MADLLLIVSIISIWFAVLEAIIIMIGAIRFIRKQSSVPLEILQTEQMLEFPTVTVMVPAHNEAIVIANTVEHILKLHYPANKIQIIVIADNCTDSTADKLRTIKAKPEYVDRDFVILERTGTGGKSGALNDALKLTTSEWICVYDADAAPERNALMFLVRKALEDPERYGAVFGRNKVRNRGQNFLTRCINLEIVTMQRIYHTGMWELLKLGTIPGTNFIVRTNLMQELGGWDVHAITEDTAISIEILKRGQLIALAAQAEAYQQEPEQLSVYMKQRQRWAKGNFYVVIENLPLLFRASPWRIKLEVLYFAASYFWFMMAIVISDIVFVVNLIYRIIGWFYPTIISPFQFSADVYVYLVIAWALMYYLYVLQINLALATDFGQSHTGNFVLSCISYFTYAQLFIVISMKAFVSLLIDKITKRESKWYKTERFN
ncbi:cellulose synthase/poly-beta-1,6-N-acetylglucosamine synthase-like glycosyltransferase [Paenibacillus shirakamiensis]|uniref:Cellulose synthase/poly-beta-1,6-N-acetylglucosamine synthase-like glycosyltransferase n=1 Tax=Paenibacillus shirakamiensis TaxID=1265935 RepID=A0ABS4JMZ1_9BACL|nr:glycosyltransferase [Paenibacillus shirakamiensis]MBP2001989.1 cellulose synthase/poly-beta-1,6-N-acetylglucosamine synthase-like glycosyltransferase [Paenibacillus shirakamiensis]